MKDTPISKMTPERLRVELQSAVTANGLLNRGIAALRKQLRDAECDIQALLQSQGDDGEGLLGQIKDLRKQLEEAKGERDSLQIGFDAGQELSGSKQIKCDELTDKLGICEADLATANARIAELQKCLGWIVDYDQNDVECGCECGTYNCSCVSVIAIKAEEALASASPVSPWTTIVPGDEATLPNPNEQWNILLHDAEGDCLDYVRTSYENDTAKYFSQGDEYTLKEIAKLFTRWQEIKLPIPPVGGDSNG